MKLKHLSPLILALLAACQSSPAPNGTPNLPKPSARPDLDLSKGSGSPSLGFVSPLGALPANSVILIGSNLGSATSVTFNGSAVTFTAVDDNQVRVMLPSASNEGVFVVTTPNGSASLNNGSLEITALSVSSGTVGSTVSLTGSGFSSATSVRFNGTEASFTVVNGSEIRATVPGGASDGPLSVTTAKGTATSSASFDVTNKVLFVKADSSAETKTGASWSAAFSDLQQALTAAAAGDEIWVAKGKYLPSSSNDRSASFTLKENVKVYGGFAGSEKDVSARDWKTNKTLLSGDLDGNDTYATGSIANLNNNSNHVVIGASNATLDGFTISGGNSYTVSPATFTVSSVASNNGAGIYNAAASLTLRNLVFSYNMAYEGGGLYNQAGSVSLSNVVFYQNTQFSRGAGLISYGGTLNISNAVFASNSGGDAAIAMYLVNTTAQIKHVALVNNRQQNINANAFHVTGGAVTLTNVLFYNNAYSFPTQPVQNGMITAAANPFVNSADPDGPDDIWLTSDDGLRLADSATSVLNQGVNTDLTTDILGNGRVGNPDPGAYEKQ